MRTERTEHLSLNCFKMRLTARLTQQLRDVVLGHVSWRRTQLRFSDRIIAANPPSHGFTTSSQTQPTRGLRLCPTETNPKQPLIRLHILDML